MNELPNISKSMYASSTTKYPWEETQSPACLGRQPGFLAANPAAAALGTPIPTPIKEPSMRIVKVFVADTNINIPLGERVLYSGEEKLTDLTDQELFYEINIGELLKTHNINRRAILDKAASDKFGRNIYLEEARVRDLKMVVVDIAIFA